MKSSHPSFQAIPRPEGVIAAFLDRQRYSPLSPATVERDQPFPRLGILLHLLRELQRKSRTEVALAAGISKTQLINYEKGLQMPHLTSLSRYLSALDIPPWFFFCTLHLIEGLEAHSPAQGSTITPESAFTEALQGTLSLYCATRAAAGVRRRPPARSVEMRGASKAGARQEVGSFLLHVFSCATCQAKIRRFLERPLCDDGHRQSIARGLEERR